tara:strand:- start:140 stop:289 length:150 start_codon:yes stop_codon:yes gene_type:complete
MNEFILYILGVILVIYFLGRYAIEEGQRVERQKKFFKNMNEYDKKIKNK